MNNNIQELLAKHKQEVEYRTDRTKAPFGGKQLSEAAVKFELAEKTEAIAYGGIQLIHQIAIQSGLIDALNKVTLLKKKLPYSESDHLINITKNFLCGGTALEHIEYRRQDPTYLNMFGTHSIPDPTTAGDFCRRFTATQIDLLQDAINYEARLKVWAKQPKSFFNEAIVDLDGVIAPTNGECKEGVDISYKGIWGYNPLIVSLANTKEILYVMNRSGNRPSHEGAHVYVDKCIELLRKAGFNKIRFRGDTDFSQTAHLDRWDDEKVLFVFGIDAMKNLKGKAEKLEDKDWKPFVRPPKYEVKTVPRGKAYNYKKAIVEARGYRNLTLEHEDIAVITYTPLKCKKSYKVVILRKTITVKKGQQLLMPDIRYYFYITNDYDKSAEQIVFEANQRCNQENILAQLNSMNALSMPLNTLNANWVYLLCGCLAWSLKSWVALWHIPDDNNIEEVKRRDRLLKMEFRSFLQAMIFIPAQILHSGRRVVVRLLNINNWTSTFFRIVESLRPLYNVRRE